VVVAHENRVVMGETLEEGLNALFGSGGAALRRATAQDSARYARGRADGCRWRPPSPAPGPVRRLQARSSDLLREAQMHYDRAIAAQRAGNWAELWSRDRTARDDDPCPQGG